MRTLLVVLVALAVALAGCSGGPRTPPTGTDPTSGPTPTDDEFSPYDPSNTPRPTQTIGTPGTRNPTGGPTPPPLPPGGEYAAFSLFDTGGTWGEPSIGITASGALFVTAASSLLRSQDNGETWSDVTSTLQFTTFDPYLWVDPATDRVFHVNLLVAGSFLAYSDNDGDSWTEIPYSGGPGDHQKLTSGPPRSSIPGSGVAYDSVLYYTVNNQQTMVSLSLDGGNTWSNEIPISPPLLCGGGGLNGQPHGTNTGAILIPYYQECTAAGSSSTYTTVYVASSTNGATWARTEVSRDFGGGFFDPDLASDQAGNVYLAYMGGAPGNYSLYLSRSENDGGSWETPIRIAPSALGTILFPTIVAGAAGELWISYVATDEGSIHPNEAPETTEWYLYTTRVTAAHTDAHQTTTYLVDPHPVHLGRVSTEGFTPEGETGDDDRNLLEFIDSTFDRASGRLWITYTDGCPADICTKKSQSNGQDVMVARLDVGPNFLVQGATVAPVS